MMFIVDCHHSPHSKHSCDSTRPCPACRSCSFKSAFESLLKEASKPLHQGKDSCISTITLLGRDQGRRLVRSIRQIRLNDSLECLPGNGKAIKSTCEFGVDGKSVRPPPGYLRLIARGKHQMAAMASARAVQGPSKLWETRVKTATAAHARNSKLKIQCAQLTMLEEALAQPRRQHRI